MARAREAWGRIAHLGRGDTDPGMFERTKVAAQERSPIPLSMMVVQHVPAVQDAGGGQLLVLKPAPAQTLGKTWAALVAVQDAYGRLAYRALKGTDLNKVCEQSEHQSPLSEHLAVFKQHKLFIFTFVGRGDKNT